MEIQEAREIIEQSIKDAGYDLRYSSGNHGRVYWDKKIAYVPFAKSRSTLYVLCHEASHVFWPKGSLRTFENEYRSERKAHEYMRMFGFSVPLSQTQRAKEYVARRVRMSIRRGLKEKVSSEVRKFIK